MLFSINLDIVDIIIKGMLIGIIASAPMGPVGILCIQRTLNKGRWYGFVTGVGAACSDIIYALITGLGMSFVMDFITEPTNKFWLQIVGSVVLMLFGLYCFRSKPAPDIQKRGKGQGTYWHNALTAFLLTFSNPLIIFLFIAAYAQFAFTLPNDPVETAIGYLSIFGGALLWWFCLTKLVDKVRAKFEVSGIRILNRIIGSLVILFSLVVLVCTVFKLYSFH